jgi:hypothetical protein
MCWDRSHRDARGQPAATQDNDYDEVPGWEVVKL